MNTLRNLSTGRFGYLALAGVLLVFLLIGSGTRPATPDAARIAYLENIIRCPSCADLPVAQSEASSATGVRSEITTYVQEGLSDQSIESRIEAEYPDTLLVPTGGTGIALFVIPALVILLGAIALGVLIVRQARRRPAATSNADAVLVAKAQRQWVEGR